MKRSHRRPSTARAFGPSRLSRPSEPAAREGGEPGAGLAVSHPAMAFSLAFVALLVASLVTHRLLDTDLWQHLAVGRAIWERHGIPMRHEWTWPSWGRPEIPPSWLFRALLWPFWRAGGEWGLQAWRWLATLGALAIAIATGRRLGGRGLLPLLGVVLAALALRQRTQVRPETLAFVLAALQLWLLETRRQGGSDRRWALPLLAVVWVNAHLSWWIGLFLTAVFAADAAWRSRTDPGARAEARALAGWLAVSALASLANPSGWRALWQPFEYQFTLRNDPLFRTIAELRPVDWSVNVRDGLPLLVVLWPALALVRTFRRGPDGVEWTLLLVMGALGLSSQRFLGFFALLAAPYLMRGLGAAGAGRAAPGPWPRALLTALAGLALVAPELAREDVPLGVGIETRFLPVGATAFMAREGVRGRGLNAYWQAGWLLWRFPGERDRLPFVDVHQSASPADRAHLAALGADPGAFRALEEEWRYDWVLWPRHAELGGQLAEQLDADPAWRLVFADDAALLWARTSGPLANVAARDGYRWLAGSPGRLAELGRRCEADTALAAATGTELRRAIADSPTQSSMARSLLANLELQSARFGAALAQLDTVSDSRSLTPLVEERRGVALLALGRPREALAAFEAQRRQTPAREGLADLEAAARESLAVRGR